jgi:hypothetical protein
VRAVAWCSIEGGDRIGLVHGDLIGRLGTAALVVDDARVSEAHALVSLRHGALHLLALRGRFRVAGRVRTDISLTPGLAIELAPGLTIDVEEVELPPTLLGIEGRDLPRQILPGTVALDVHPLPRLRPGWHPDAAAQLWSLDDAWRIAVHAGPPRDLREGDRVDIDGWTLHAVGVPLGDAGRARTRVDFAAAIAIEAAVDTVTITVGDAPPAIIGGMPARLLSELVALAGPASWAAVARELWRDEDPAVLRRRWDVALARVRSRLRDLGARDDLVHADGAGHVELLLRPGDQARMREEGG